MTAIMLPHNIRLLENAKQKQGKKKKATWIWRSFAFLKKKCLQCLERETTRNIFFCVRDGPKKVVILYSLRRHYKGSMNITLSPPILLLKEFYKESKRVKSLQKSRILDVWQGSYYPLCFSKALRKASNW